MKASDYLQKHEAFFFGAVVPDYDAANLRVREIFGEFYDELNSIIEERKIRLAISCLAVLREQNEKWNALVRLFEKKYGVSPIRYDGFKDVYGKRINDIVCGRDKS